jgi:pimeloyl-ACP methyl ester carboxylesterase
VSTPKIMSTNSYSSVHPPAHIEQCGSGPPVLLLHGWGVSSALFQPTMIGLKHAFTLIAPDFPGFGATPPPPTPWSANDYAVWVIAVLDSLNIRQVYVIGHSHGGRVAIKLASQWPERVIKLVLADSAGIRPKRTLRYWVQVQTYKSWRWLSHASLIPLPLRNWAGARVAQHGSPDYLQAAGTVRASLVRVVNEDLRDLLPHIQAPTLLVWGENDEDTPVTNGQLMEKLIPDAGLVVLKGAGHYAYLEHSTYFCHIIETFFRGTS